MTRTTNRTCIEEARLESKSRDFKLDSGTSPERVELSLVSGGAGTLPVPSKGGVIHPAAERE